VLHHPAPRSRQVQHTRDESIALSCTESALMSGHVSSTRRRNPLSLCSVRVTRRHRSYGQLRLLDAIRLLLAIYTCRRLRSSFSVTPRPPWLPHILLSSSTGLRIPGRHRMLAFTHTTLSPAGSLKPSANSNEYPFGTTPSRKLSHPHSTSLVFVTTHQSSCHQLDCKPRY
jgi:hypothetical protein